MHVDTIRDLLSPLTPEEQKKLPGIVCRLFANEEFQLLFRHMNQASGDVMGTVFDKTNDAIKAAGLEGLKVFPREFLGHYIAGFHEPKDKPTTQDTTTTP